nr:hypothetical protein [uncultured bacterium]
MDVRDFNIMVFCNPFVAATKSTQTLAKWEMYIETDSFVSIAFPEASC